MRIIPRERVPEQMRNLRAGIRTTGEEAGRHQRLDRSSSP
jgi:hypothetical protein